MSNIIEINHNPAWMVLRNALLGIAGLLLSALCFPQQTPQLPVAQIPVAQFPVVQLREAIARTLADNPALRAEGYLLQAQEARILQTTVKPAPELMVMTENLFGSGENDMLRGAQTTFSVAWFLEHGVRETRVAAETATLNLLTVDRDVSRLDAAAATARLYLNCLALQTEMDYAVQAIAQAEATVVAVTARVEAGAVPQAELARARTDLAQHELAKEDIEHETIAAYHRLAAQWGLTTPDFSRVGGDVMQLPTIQDFPLFEARIEQNPDITRFLSQQRMYESQLRLAEVSYKSPWRVSAGVRQLELTGDHAFVADMTIPLARRDSNRGRLEEARANLARTDAEEAAERTRIRTELYVLYLELNHYLEVAAALRNNIIPLNETALAETQTAYEQGRYNYQELSTAQDALLAARNDLVTQSIEAHRRLIEIERFTGLTIEANQP